MVLGEIMSGHDLVAILPVGAPANNNLYVFSCHSHENSNLKEIFETCILLISKYWMLWLDCEHLKRSP
jgi:hypothetical protein